MSAIDVEADAKGAPKIQAKTALDAKSSLQLLEKYIAFDSQCRNPLTLSRRESD